MLRAGIIAGDDTAAHVGGDHIDDGVGTGGFKQDIRVEIQLAEIIFREIPHGGFPGHQCEGFLAESFEGKDGILSLVIRDSRPA